MYRSHALKTASEVQVTDSSTPGHDIQVYQCQAIYILVIVSSCAQPVMGVSCNFSCSSESVSCRIMTAGLVSGGVNT
jgi:hypothetical protein